MSNSREINLNEIDNKIKNLKINQLKTLKHQLMLGLYDKYLEGANMALLEIKSMKNEKPSQKQDAFLDTYKKVLDENIAFCLEAYKKESFCYKVAIEIEHLFDDKNYAKCIGDSKSYLSQIKQLKQISTFNSTIAHSAFKHYSIEEYYFNRINFLQSLYSSTEEHLNNKIELSQKKIEQEQINFTGDDSSCVSGLTDLADKDSSQDPSYQEDTATSLEQLNYTNNCSAMFLHSPSEKTGQAEAQETTGIVATNR